MALDNASVEKHIDVLEWWLKSGLELKYCKRALNYGLRKGVAYIEVLKWWGNSKLPLKYTEDALDGYKKKIGLK